MAYFRYPGPICCINPFDESDFGTMCLAAMRPPGPVAAPISAADYAEFKIVHKMNVLNSKGQLYTTAQMYIDDRDLYFGGGDAYASFKLESDTELASTQWVGKKRTVTLRQLLEFGKHAEQQDIFYRWVRKAYKKTLGDGVDVPSLIRRGMTPELEELLKEVRAEVKAINEKDAGFHAGGFNPRPKKIRGSYRFGTLSEHGLGLAIDIDPDQNPQIDLKIWGLLEKFVGKKVNRVGQFDTKEHAEAAWKAIVDCSNQFVAKCASEVQRIEKERATAKPAPGSPGQKPAVVKPALAEALGDLYQPLGKYAKTGFFTLPLDLVLALQEHGFEWGGTWSDQADLQHFQISPPKPAAKKTQ